MGTDRSKARSARRATELSPPNRRAIADLLLTAITVLSVGCSSASHSDSAPPLSSSDSPAAMLIKTSQSWPSGSFDQSRFRGWDHLAGRLGALGVSDQDLLMVYADPRMPPFSFVPFSLRPKETTAMYSGFASRRHYEMGARFVRKHEQEFDRMEAVLQVPREVVTAILVIESQLGENTGNHSVLYRLSRVAAVGDPNNLRKNYERLKESDSSVRFEEVAARAEYLEKTFLPEIPHLIEIAKRNRIDIHGVRGSIAGAFGLPQFLPSAFVRFGIDGDQDGHVSLYNEVDALWSAANYLGKHGYKNSLSLEERRAIIWQYNKSDAYIDTVLAVAAGIGRILASRPL